ncbi:ricin-type beta-trefoil lectin domain protein [Streptomyces sp. NPDC013157]|uniref:ricin-type beta-trefoil lectin domain protein n=1 Tax=Streptomyces sp. NPDC013157 TaxID=3364861 RepID=UPI003693B1DE
MAVLHPVRLEPAAASATHRRPGDHRSAVGTLPRHRQLHDRQRHTGTAGDCNGGSNHRWTYSGGNQLVVYGNKCLGVGRSTGSGSPAAIWNCSGQADQQGNANPDGTITAVRSGLCLDANGQATGNGTKVRLWACTGGANQHWSLMN